MWPFAGGLVGVVNGLTRWTTISHLSSEAVTRSLLLMLGGMVLRLGFVAGLLIVGLKQGIDAGLLAFAGLWVTRWLIVIWSNARQGPRARRLARRAGE